MNFSDLNRVISKEVVPFELKIGTLGIESQYHSVVVKELLLRLNSSTTKLFLQELQELWIFLWWDWDLSRSPGISRACLTLSLLLINVLEERSCVPITIINADGSSADSEIEANSEVSGLEWHLASVLLEHHLSFQEWSLHSTTVHFFWFGNDN